MHTQATAFLGSKSSLKGKTLMGYLKQKPLDPCKLCSTIPIQSQQLANPLSPVLKYVQMQGSFYSCIKIFMDTFQNSRGYTDFPELLKSRVLTRHFTLSCLCLMMARPALSPTHGSCRSADISSHVTGGLLRFTATARTPALAVLTDSASFS